MVEVPESIDSKFRLVLLAAQRAEQLMRGAAPRVDSKHNRRARVALDEIRAGSVSWGYGPPESEETGDADAEPSAE